MGVVEELVGDWPLWAVFAGLWVVAMLRSNATYWAGRGLRAGGSRTRLASHLDRPAVVRTEAFVVRWGAPAVALGFLTIGVQTLVNAAAGALRMPLPHYLPATAVGSLLWAALYTSVGAALREAVTGGEWWWLGVALVGAVVTATTTAWVRRAASARPRSTP